jgi:hypothetical protein
MRTQALRFDLLILVLLFVRPFGALAQSDSLVVWKGCISGIGTNAVIPHATIASFKRVALYVSDEKGCFNLELDYNDSIRIAALGYEARTIVLSKQMRDSVNNLSIKLKQFSFNIREVTVKGYRGMLDPLIFPKHLDDSNQIDLHLPANFGSQITNVPPHERPDAGNMGLLGAVFSPASFIHSKFSRAEKAKLRLPQARQEARMWNHREAIAGREVMALISGYEGEELDSFMIYCNIHLKLSAIDNGITATRKLEVLLVQYQGETQHETPEKTH